MAEATCSFIKRNGSTMDVLIRETVDQDTLTQELQSMSVMTDITSMKQAEETLRIQAETDSLTGLLNRDGFTNVIHRYLEKSRQEGSQAAMIFLDLDRFKWVNDNLGHGAGDELLKSIGHRIQMVTRKGEYVGRFGGDEFAVVVQGHHASDRIVEISRAIMATVGEATYLRGREFKVAVSIGVSVYPDHADDALDLIKAADVAMYQRKNSGRNGFTVFNQRLGQHAGQFLEYEQLINQALANDWFELHLQPIINLENNRMTSMEALLRLNHPERGLIAPSEIIATAEKSSQILDIGDRVIDLAMQHLSDFKQIPHLVNCNLTVNFSAAQFLPGLPTKLASKFMQYGLQPEKLILEITETVLMQETENLVEIFDAIEQLGCTFALDDFGTGYSSLLYLNKFPVSMLKIDRSFVQMMAEESSEEFEKSKTETLVQGIIAMSHALDLQVVVEGIETKSDAARVSSMGADKAQGYYFSRPVPLEQLKGNEELTAGSPYMGPVRPIELRR